MKLLTKHTNLYDLYKLDRLAKLYFKEITRKDGTLYYYHLDRARQNAQNLYVEVASDIFEQDVGIIVNNIYSLATHHDSIEDIYHNKENFKNALNRDGINVELYDSFIDSIHALSRDKKTTDIVTYLNGIINDDPLTILVKIGDTMDNLRDLSAGNLRDKYILSLFYIYENVEWLKKSNRFKNANSFIEYAINLGVE